MHRELKKFPPLSGNILDLGGYNSATYWNYLNPRTGDCRIFAVDIALKNKPQIVADLEKGLPLGSEVFDYVLLFNLLEHVFSYQELIIETKRVLKPSGLVLCFVPFLKEFHADPHDYFRYTHSALEKIFRRGGFTHIRIVSKGGIFTVGANLSGVSLKVFPLKIMANLIALGLDFLVKIAFGDRFEHSYVLGYFVIAGR
ncbi:MAG: class I SAM-dependent methyltransferase [Candidatus Brocadiaceae bacterium]|nr:class I SAM-dependent methyltransferase [Candidatus Brocadiaceae bacterium]